MPAPTVADHYYIDHTPTSGDGQTITGIDAAVGDTVLVVITRPVGNGSTYTVTDSAGNTYANVGTVWVNSRLSSYQTTVTSALTGGTITLNGSNASHQFFVLVLSGVSSTVTDSGNPGAYITDGANHPTVSPTLPSVVLGIEYRENAAAPTAEPAGYTVGNDDAAGTRNFAWAYKTSAVTGAQAPTWTWPDTSTGILAASWAFNGTAGAPVAASSGQLLFH